MSKYKLIIEDDRKFFGAFKEANLNFSGCTLKEFVIEPEENFWQIRIVTEKNFDEQTLRAAEEFLRNRFSAQVEFKREVLAEVISIEKKSAPQKTFPAKRTNGKKISGDVTKIID